MAVSQVILAITADINTYSLGIYNCRRVVGGLQWSLHAEGRAFDLGWRAGTTYPEKAEALGRFMWCAGLGVQRLIADRRLYDYETPRGRDYTGADPHTGHAHIEFSWAASRTLTVERVRDLLGREGEGDVEVQQAYDELAKRIGSRDAPDTILGDLRWIKEAINVIVARLPPK